MAWRENEGSTGIKKEKGGGKGVKGVCVGMGEGGRQVAALERWGRDDGGREELVRESREVESMPEVTPSSIQRATNFTRLHMVDFNQMFCC